MGDLQLLNKKIKENGGEVLAFITIYSNHGNKMKLNTIHEDVNFTHPLSKDVIKTKIILLQKYLLYLLPRKLPPSPVLSEATI